MGRHIEQIDHMVATMDVL